MNIKVFILLVCTVVSINLNAQNKLDSIRLLDENDHSPIADANFTYANYHGTSNQEGIIQFRYIEGATMSI